MKTTNAMLITGVALLAVISICGCMSGKERDNVKSITAAGEKGYQRAIDMIKENNTNFTEVLTLCKTIDPDHSAYCRIDALCTAVEENKLEQICYNYSYQTRLTPEIRKEMDIKFVSSNHCEEYRKACTEPLEAVKECESEAYKKLAEYEKMTNSNNKSNSIDGCRNNIAGIAVAQGKIEEARKICDGMDYPESRYNCYNGIDCNKLTSESRNSCITSKADLCGTISSRKQEQDRAYCIMQIAAQTKAKDLCERIPENVTEGNTRQLCIKWSA